MSVTAPIIRVDKFIVSESSKQEFLLKIRETHQFLKEQPGFVRDLILEQISGSGNFNIITIAEWENQAAIDDAKSKIAKFHRERGFEPQLMMQKLGIKSDIANYQPVADGG